VARHAIAPHKDQDGEPARRGDKAREITCPVVWDPTVFTKNRERLQSGEVFAKFMTKLLNHPQVKPLLSELASRRLTARRASAGRRRLLWP
jgi:hypothetical protein